MPLSRINWRNLSRRGARLHGLEHHAMKQRRLAFFHQHAGEDSLAVARAAQAAGLYSKTTYVPDIARTIEGLRERGALP